jgi:hypothetical protein
MFLSALLDCLTVQIADRLDGINNSIKRDFVRLHRLLNGFSNVAQTSVDSSLKLSINNKLHTRRGEKSIFTTSRIPVSVAAFTDANNGPYRSVLWA